MSQAASTALFRLSPARVAESHAEAIIRIRLWIDQERVPVRGQTLEARLFMDKAMLMLGWKSHL